MTDDPHAKSTGGLVADALQHLSNLVRGEIALARAEAVAKLRQAARGLVLLIVTAVLALIALCLLSAGAVLALIDAGLTPLIAALLCAGVIAVLATVAGIVGFRSLTPSGLSPDRSVRNLKRDAHTLKEMIHHEHAH